MPTPGGVPVKAVEHLRFALTVPHSFVATTDCPISPKQR
jgi:hypothetical protein